MVNTTPQVVVAAVEGYAIAGGFGLLCVSDVAICTEDAGFAMSETAIGIVPAQIAPFVAARIGVPQTRHLALTAARFKGPEALRLGIAHYLVKDSAALDAKLEEVLKQIDRCAPLANALTKAVVMKVGSEPLSAVLDFAADKFAEARRSPEAAEGLRAFAEKRPPKWADRMIVPSPRLHTCRPARVGLSAPHDVPCRSAAVAAGRRLRPVAVRRQPARAAARRLVVATPLARAPGRVRLRARRRGDAGDRRGRDASAGHVAGFRRHGNGHHLVNRSEAARVLEVGTRTAETAHYLRHRHDVPRVRRLHGRTAAEMSFQDPGRQSRRDRLARHAHGQGDGLSHRRGLFRRRQGRPARRFADEAVRIGPPPVGESYLSIDRILEAAHKSGADAVHPGYGFLSENEAFAAACEKAGLVFIGPPPAAIAAMGNKAAAKRRMIDAGVPCVPGYQGADQSDANLEKEARKIGLPVMVKAAAGGGGRGMRLVERDGDLVEAIRTARAEAESAFGSGELILEKAVVDARHVEIQVFADAHGNVIHLGERDCSVQRRHQKVIEEAPSPAVDADLRHRMGAAAVAAARAIGYRGAGTVEFLLGGDGAFYFLEMNTRLQVEHPVTEAITGQDLVAWQLQGRAPASGCRSPRSR